MKTALLNGLIIMVLILSGCQAFVPKVPPGVTFNNPQPRWSWTGTWRASDGSSINIVQKDNEWVASSPGNGIINGVAALNGNRALGRTFPTDMVPREFEFQLSDDGMYAQGTVKYTAIGWTLDQVLTRISKNPASLQVNPVASNINSTQQNPPVEPSVELVPGHGYIGVILQDLASKSGGHITQVTAQTPAARSGLKAGDIILMINGKFVDNITEMKRLIAASPNTPLNLEVLRSGERLPITVTPLSYQGNNSKT